MASLEQECAGYAWEQVRGLRNGTRKAYKNLAKSMPALVMTNGLMQTLAFLKGKGGKEHEALLSHIVGWLQRAHVVEPNAADFTSVMEWWGSGACTTWRYQQATEQALQVLRWIRYFADALEED